MKLKWQLAPVKTQSGDDMVVASVAIDKNHTVCLYFERDQTTKVEAMFTQRTWVGLTDEQIDELSGTTVKGNKSVNWLAREIEAKLREKNSDI